MKRRQRSLIIHPRMARALSRIFNSRATLGIYTIVYDALNQPIDSVFTPSTSPGLLNILCYVEPLNNQRDQEAAKPNQIVITDMFSIALCGFFPQIKVSDYIRIDETIYNITGAVSDDTNTITFLNVQIVNKPVENVLL